MALTLDVRTPAGTTAGTVDLPAEIFDKEPNIALMLSLIHI